MCSGSISQIDKKSLTEKMAVELLTLESKMGTSQAEIAELIRSVKANIFDD